MAFTATPLAFPLTPAFDLQSVVGQLGVMFQRKGYTVRSYPLGAGACLELTKNKGDLNVVLGRCEGLKVYFMPGATMLNVSFSDEEWSDKIVAFVVGWFTCGIAWLTGIIGLYNQYQLPKQVEAALRLIMGSVSVPQASYYQWSAAQPWTYQPYQAYSPPASRTEPPESPSADPSAAPHPDTPPMGKKICPACGRSIDEDCVFCMYCGVKQ